MKILLTILTEVAHLFADDGMLAGALLAWTATVGLGVWLSPKLASGPCAAGLVLGYAALLLGNVVRARHQR
jgi:uncharacterized membrane protein YccC